MYLHFELPLSPRVSCGIAVVGAVIVGYNPNGSRVPREEMTAHRISVTCTDCKRTMGGVDVGRIKLAPAQIGVMLYLAGRWAVAESYVKPKESTYARLRNARLIESSNAFPFHALTDDGRHWLHANHPSGTAA